MIFGLNSCKVTKITQLDGLRTLLKLTQMDEIKYKIEKDGISFNHDGSDDDDSIKLAMPHNQKNQT